MSYLDDSLAKTREFEGSAAWMYLDTDGVVTVGVGRALFDVKDALALPFSVEGRKAMLSEIANDFRRVSSMPEGLAAYRYKAESSPELSEQTIDAMLHAKIEEFDSGLAAQLPGYITAPDAAKLAVLDMAYELGVHGVLKFTHLCKAVEAGDFLDAAGECRRVGPNDARNNWTRDQFLAAAKLQGVIQ